MRMDKYLKNARLIKRRTVANEACTQGRVRINGQTAKPASNVAIGDEIVISFGNRTVKLVVTNTGESVKKQDADQMYKVVDP